MAPPNANYGDILATTIQKLAPTMVDALSNNNAALYKMKQRKNVKPFDGGPKIVQSLDYAENSTYTRYSGYEQIDTSASQTFTAAEYAIKQVAVTVTMSGLEMIKSAGKSQVFDLMDARIENAKRTFENNFSTDIYSDGTASGGKQVGGLQLLIADDPTTGTVGGINRASHTWWRASKYAGVADGGAAVSSTNIQEYMRKLWLLISTGNDKPDLIVADNTYFEYFEGSLTAIQRIQSESNEMAKAGFDAYEFKKAPVVFDGGDGGACPSAHMYFINTKYLYLRPFSGRQFSLLNPDRHAVNQDAVVKIQAWAGNLCLSHGRRQGVLIA